MSAPEQNTSYKCTRAGQHDIAWVLVGTATCVDFVRVRASTTLPGLALQCVSTVYTATCVDCDLSLFVSGVTLDPCDLVTLDSCR